MSGRINLSNLSDSLKEHLNGLGLTEEQVNELIENALDEINEKDIEQDEVVNGLVEKVGELNGLMTEEKGDLVGAINELFQDVDSGKTIIADAIDDDNISKDSTFAAMGEAIDGLNTTITLLNNQINSLTNELAGKVTPAGTAVAGDVISGKTFINSTGNTITGGMTNQGSKTFTPSASKQTGAAGYYSDITCNAVSNLSAGNIKSGVVVGGVTGTCAYYTVTSPGSTTWIAATTISDKSWGYTNGSYINIHTSNAAPATGTYNIYIKVFGADSSDAFRIRLYTSKNRTLAKQNGSPDAAISGNYSLSKGEILYYQIDSQNGGYGAHVGFDIQAVTYTIDLY